MCPVYWDSLNSFTTQDICPSQRATEQSLLFFKATVPLSVMVQKNIWFWSMKNISVKTAVKEFGNFSEKQPRCHTVHQSLIYKLVVRLLERATLLVILCKNTGTIVFATSSPPRTNDQTVSSESFNLLI